MSTNLDINRICENNYENNYENDYYIYLKNNWNNIFPDGNRNAAGSVFFKYIMSLENLTYNDFLEFNKLYCSVSGSLISSGSQPDLIKLKDLNNNNICGYYYKCCWPCVCDVMKYAQVIELTHQFCFSNSPVNFHVIVIENPCNKPTFPNEVNRHYFCNDRQLNENNVLGINVYNKNYLIIGLLHNSQLCSKNQIDIINNNESISNFRCKKRNNMTLDELRYGMGDIFIKIAQ